MNWKPFKETELSPPNPKELIINKSVVTRSKLVEFRLLLAITGCFISSALYGFSLGTVNLMVPYLECWVADYFNETCNDEIELSLAVVNVYGLINSLREGLER